MEGLEKAEGNLIELLEIAGKTTDLLQDIKNFDENQLSHLSKTYTEKVDEIQKEILDKTRFVKNYVPYSRNCSSRRKDKEILRSKVNFLRAYLKQEDERKNAATSSSS